MDSGNMLLAFQQMLYLTLGAVYHYCIAELGCGFSGCYFPSRYAN